MKLTTKNIVLIIMVAPFVTVILLGLFNVALLILPIYFLYNIIMGVISLFGKKGKKKKGNNNFNQFRDSFGYVKMMTNDKENS